MNETIKLDPPIGSGGDPDVIVCANGEVLLRIELDSKLGMALMAVARKAGKAGDQRRGYLGDHIVCRVGKRGAEDSVGVTLPVKAVIAGLGENLISVGDALVYEAPNLYKPGTRPGLRVTVEVIPQTEEEHG